MDTRNQQRPQHPYRGRRQRFPSVTEFCTMLRQHTFYFREAKRASEMKGDDLDCMIRRLEQEMNLYRLAWEGGDEYMQVLSSYMTSERERLIPKKTTEDHAAAAIIQVTDPAVLDYAVRLQRFDWYHSFSDDGAVLRNGADGEEKLKKEGINKGGIYKQLWDHYVKVRSDNISRS